MMRRGRAGVVRAAGGGEEQGGGVRGDAQYADIGVLVMGEGRRGGEEVEK